MLYPEKENLSREIHCNTGLNTDFCQKLIYLKASKSLSKTLVPLWEPHCFLYGKGAEISDNKVS